MSTRRPSVKNHFVSNFATFARFSDVAIYVLTIRARIQEWFFEGTDSQAAVGGGC